MLNNVPNIVIIHFREIPIDKCYIADSQNVTLIKFNIAQIFNS